jgi:hypothetical protein
MEPNQSILFTVIMALFMMAFALIQSQPKTAFSFFGMMEQGAKLFKDLVPPVLIQKNEAEGGAGPDLVKELQGAESRLREMLTKQSDEIRKQGETSLQTIKDIKAAEKKLEAIEQKMQAQSQQLNDIEASQKGLGGRGQYKSLGERVTESDSFKSYKEGKVGRARVELERKALTLDSGSGNAGAGNLIVPQRIPGVVFPLQNQVHVRDLLLPGQTTNNMLEFNEETAFFPVATELSAQEAIGQTVLSVKSVRGFFVGQNIYVGSELRTVSAVGTTDITISVATTILWPIDTVVGSYQVQGQAEGSLKPQGLWKSALRQSPVITVPFFFKIAKQAMDDIPQLMSILDARAMQGLMNAEDWHLLFGAGSPNINGLMNTAQAYNRTTVGDTKLDVLRRARTQVRLQEAMASFAVLNPEDWEAIELLKGTDDRYLWVNVNDGGVERLWKMPVIDTTVMPEGSWLVGDGAYAQVFDRQDATIEIFEQDEDNVQRNLLTVRVEERLALVKYRPTAFVKGTY